MVGAFTEKGEHRGGTSKVGGRRTRRCGINNLNIELNHEGLPVCCQWHPFLRIKDILVFFLWFRPGKSLMLFCPHGNSWNIPVKHSVCTYDPGLPSCPDALFHQPLEICALPELRTPPLSPYPALPWPVISHSCLLLPRTISFYMHSILDFKYHLRP